VIARSSCRLAAWRAPGAGEPGHTALPQAEVRDLAHNREATAPRLIVPCA
jgi:hypothetical protein